MSERAVLSLDLKTCSLHTLSHGMDLPLFLTVTASQSQTANHLSYLIPCGGKQITEHSFSPPAPPAGVYRLFCRARGRDRSEAGAWLRPASVEHGERVLSGVGDMRRLAAPQPLCALRTPVDVISTPAGRLHRLLSSGPTESGYDPARRDTSLPVGAEGEHSATYMFLVSGTCTSHFIATSSI